MNKIKYVIFTIALMFILKSNVYAQSYTIVESDNYTKKEKYMPDDIYAELTNSTCAWNRPNKENMIKWKTIEYENNTFEFLLYRYCGAGGENRQVVYINNTFIYESGAIGNNEIPYGNVKFNIFLLKNNTIYYKYITYGANSISVFLFNRQAAPTTINNNNITTKNLRWGYQNGNGGASSNTISGYTSFDITNNTVTNNVSISDTEEINIIYADIPFAYFTQTPNSQFTNYEKIYEFGIPSEPPPPPIEYKMIDITDFFIIGVEELNDICEKLNITYLTTVDGQYLETLIIANMFAYFIIILFIVLLIKITRKLFKKRRIDRWY